MSIRKEVLRNGLTVVTESMSHVRSVSVGIWIRSGSRHETAAQNGISHFIEHMLFKGTNTRSAEDIATAIDSIGGQLDAFTTREYVGFYAKILDEYLEAAFALLADIVLRPAFPDAEVEKERNVIFEEINMVEDSPQELVHEVFTEAFWRGHPLGRPIAGTKKSVGRLRRADIAEYFARCYVPDNMVVVAAGRLRHEKLVRLVERHFGSLRGAAGPNGHAVAPRARAHVTRRDKEKLEQTHICLGTGAPAATSEARYAAHLLNNILGGSLSSRLFQNIREKRGLVYAIFSGLGLYSDAGHLTIYAGTGAKTAGTVIELILAELRRVRSSDITEAELRRAKDNIKGSIVLSLESTSSRMSNLAQQELYFRRQSTIDQAIRRIEAVSLGAVRDLAHELFDRRRLGLTVLGNLNGMSVGRRLLKV